MELFFLDQKRFYGDEGWGWGFFSLRLMGFLEHGWDFLEHGLDGWDTDFSLRLYWVLEHGLNGLDTDLAFGFWIFLGTRIGRMGYGFSDFGFWIFQEHGLDGWDTDFGLRLWDFLGTRIGRMGHGF